MNNENRGISLRKAKKLLDLGLDLSYSSIASRAKHRLYIENKEELFEMIKTKGYVAATYDFAVKCGMNPDSLRKRLKKDYPEIKNELFWTDEETTKLKNIIKRLQGTPFSNKQYLMTNFPNKTYDQIISKARRMNIISSLPMENPAWTNEEIEILKKYYPLEGKDVSNRLKRRTQTTIVSKASDLGIKHNKLWSNEEVEILRNNYNKVSSKKLTELLPNRSHTSCISKACELGIAKKIKAWTNEEDNILRKYYSTEGIAIKRRLPERSIHTIRDRAKKLKLKTVTKNKCTYELIKIGGRTNELLSSYCKRLRKKTKCTVAEFAMLHGVKAGYIKYIESGKCDYPSLSVLTKIAMIYGFSVEDIIMN